MGNKEIDIRNLLVPQKQTVKVGDDIIETTDLIITCDNRLINNGDYKPGQNTTDFAKETDRNESEINESSIHSIAIKVDTSPVLSRRSRAPFLSTIEEHSVSGETVHTIDIGEYPQSPVSEEEAEMLNDLFNDGHLKPGIVPTGRMFTVDGAYHIEHSWESKQIPEFEVNGVKYAREQIYRFRGSYENAGYEASWVRVEPIKFVIKNWDGLSKKINPKGKLFGGEKVLELQSVSDIIGRVPFSLRSLRLSERNAADDYWQNSLVRCFLNGTKTDQQDGNEKYKSNKVWDFSNGGFLNQAFATVKEAPTTYTFPSGEKQVAHNALCGCTFLKEVVIDGSIVNDIGYNFLEFCKDTRIVINNLNKIDGEFLNYENGFHYLYISKDGSQVIISPTEDESLTETHLCKTIEPDLFQTGNYSIVEINPKNQSKTAVSNILYFFNKDFNEKYLNLINLREQGKIKFMPPNYTIDVFPKDNIDCYFVNKNNMRWKNLVDLSGFGDISYAPFKEQALTNLMKIYYAIGGFSTNQGESEKAFQYVADYVLIKNESTGTINYEMSMGDIRNRFKDFKITGEYNKEFAKFFMRYYKDNKDFMVFDADELGRSDLYGEKDFLAQAHNNFAKMQELYPHRTVGGNTLRSQFSPKFVAGHTNIVTYEDVREGNEALARLAGEHGYNQEDFDKMQDIYEIAKKGKDAYVITADKAPVDMPIKFRFLEKDDPLGFVLGDKTNCCQHIGGVGESCVDDGYTNPNAGFLVFEETILDENGDPTDEVEVLAQAYIWYDEKTKTVCYDNIEIPDDVLNKLRKNGELGHGLTTEDLLKSVVESASAVMQSMNKDEVRVRQVTTGTGYNDLNEELEEHFDLDERPVAHNSPGVYSDAHMQYIILDYDESTKEFNEKIVELMDEAQRELQELEQSHQQESTM